MVKVKQAQCSYSMRKMLPLEKMVGEWGGACPKYSTITSSPVVEDGAVRRGGTGGRYTRSQKSGLVECNRSTATNRRIVLPLD